MSIEIIYERKYFPFPVITDWDWFLGPDDDIEVPDDLPTFDELYQKILAETTYVPIPERIEASDTFIRDAIDVADQHWMGVKITRRTDCIMVEYTFPNAFNLHSLGQLLAVADDFYLKIDDEKNLILLSIEYKTHDMVRTRRTRERGD